MIFLGGDKYNTKHFQLGKTMTSQSLSSGFTPRLVYCLTTQPLRTGQFSVVNLIEIYRKGLHFQSFSPPPPTPLCWWWRWSLLITFPQIVLESSLLWILRQLSWNNLEYRDPLSGVEKCQFFTCWGHVTWAIGKVELQLYICCLSLQYCLTMAWAKLDFTCLAHICQLSAELS